MTLVQWCSGFVLFCFMTFLSDGKDAIPRCERFSEVIYAEHAWANVDVDNLKYSASKIATRVRYGMLSLACPPSFREALASRSHSH